MRTSIARVAIKAVASRSPASATAHTFPSCVKSTSFGASASKRNFYQQSSAARSGNMPPSNPSARTSQIAAHMSPSQPRSASTSARVNPAQPAPGLPEPHDGGGANLDEPKVLIADNNSLCEIILNREKAINALDTDMVRGISGALARVGYARQHSVILLRATSSSRGLCSGGDVLKVVNMADSKDGSERQGALDFFQEEFQLDWRIAKLGEEVITGTNAEARPIVSYMDGITMGGGVGLSVHAPFRVATEKTMFAMPETGIGYFPDVGVTRVLSRLDGRIGTYLGMTGERITGEEAYLAGLATHFVPSSMLESLTEALATLQPGANAKQVAATIEEYTVDPFSSANSKGSDIWSKTALVGDARVAMDYVFGQPTVEAVMAALSELTSSNVASAQAASEIKQHLGVDVSASLAITAWARKTLATLQSKSPRSLKVTLQAINNEARHLNVDQSFAFDMRVATAFCDLTIGRDFYEGVHHVLSKDPKTGKRREGRAPWSPSEVKDVDDKLMKELFFADTKTARAAGLTMDVPRLVGPRQAGASEESSSTERKAHVIGPAEWEPEFNALHPLPAEAELEALLHGSHPASGSYQIDLSNQAEAVKEIVGTLQSWRSSKTGAGYAFGLESKVTDWVERRAKDATKRH